MHPQGGGQPTDTGTISVVEGSDRHHYSANINKVTVDRSTGIVKHAGSISVPSNSSIDSDYFPPNTTVRVSVDSANRQLLSEVSYLNHYVVTLFMDDAIRLQYLIISAFSSAILLDML